MSITIQNFDLECFRSVPFRYAQNVPLHRQNIIYKCVCIYIYMYIYIYIYMSLSIYIYIHIYIGIHLYDRKLGHHF